MSAKKELVDYVMGCGEGRAPELERLMGRVAEERAAISAIMPGLERLFVEAHKGRRRAEAAMDALVATVPGPGKLHLPYDDWRRKAEAELAAERNPPTQQPKRNKRPS